MEINRDVWISEMEKRIERDYFKRLNEASAEQLQYACSRQTLGALWDNWARTKQRLYREKYKIAYYFSAEFLMGRWLGNTLINLEAQEAVCTALASAGIDYNVLEDVEVDAGLGNGGLGRLAACFLDSMATHNLPAMGYGIRYKYGMFEQRIIDERQVEVPDNWLKNGEPASIKRPDEAVTVRFGGRVHVEQTGRGMVTYTLEETEDVIAVPYDMPVAGYGTDTVLTLRLWQAESADGFDLGLFQQEDYVRAVEKQNRAEDISRVLYPNDSGPSGKTLRLRQQYFFVAASLRDILNRYKRVWSADLSHLDEAVSIQMNDTHPVIAIAELMRLLIDEEGVSWEEAWEVTMRCCAYTNHTVLSEALEKWPIEIFAALLPRHYQLIEEINRRFLSFLKQLYPDDWQRQSAMAIIGDGMVRMAWLAIVGSHSINGVAELHTQILKNDVLRNWYEIFPEKFNNKTNGVTQRRWLLKANPSLAAFICEKIGKGWITAFDEIAKMKAYADDEAALETFDAIKQQNKRRLADYIWKHNHIRVQPDSIFDVQVKRIHEYKRQLLAVLHIMWLYQRLKKDPQYQVYPRTFIFGGKAASGYKQAKLIIHLINALADLINNDDDIGDKLKVVFLVNYRVSLAEQIFPAADISEQISTAGYEASGTGNMKFMMNGALTLGTMDGANVEIVEQVGRENAFIFGLSADEVRELQQTYNPAEVMSKDSELAEALGMLLSPVLAKNELDEFRPIYNSLIHGIDGNRADTYFVLKDFRAYVDIQKQAEKLYQNRREWTRKAFLNMALSGKFSSDRTVKEYAADIWHIKPLT
jgi:starch phosphorylase